MKKKLLLSISAGIVALSSFGQVSLPNGNFENWTSSTYDFPTYYPMNSNTQAFFGCQAPFNVTKSTDAYHGSFALEMTTVSNVDTCFGFATNANPSPGGGGPGAWTGGMAFNQKPTGIRGYYKYNVPSGDSAGMIIKCTLGGSTIGMYLFTLGGLHNSYTLFNLPFVPALPATPDSIIIAFVSSNPMASSVIPGSTVKFDSLSFTGVTAQPAQMNGDFELWQSQTIDMPDSWIIDNDMGAGFARTTDKAAGNYALELQTYLGDNNGSPVARGGNISTGYWDNSCGCQKGGYPFSNQVDTLAFYYKYAPANPNDSASVYLNFKSGGSMTFLERIVLHASATYQYMELPFSLFSAPDSVIVSAQSSDWADTALSFVGANLKLDEMHFKSQPLATGIVNHFSSNEVNFYPNPFRTTGTIYISSEINTSGMEVTIYDTFGRSVKKVETSEHKIIIDRNDIKNGVYFYELKNAGGIIKKGKIIIE